MAIVLVFYAAIAGVAAYNNHKLKREVSRGSLDSKQAESSQEQNPHPPSSS